MGLLVIGVILIFIISVLLVLFIINYNNYQIAIIKISEAEENIKLLLNKKMELIIRIRNLLEDKNKQIKFDDFDKLSKKLNSFELNKELSKYNKMINEVTYYNKEIKLSEEDKNILDELNDINIELEGNERYYNDNVIIYNKLIKCFPSNIVGRLFKYKVKDFYSKEKEEIFEILKK